MENKSVVDENSHDEVLSPEGFYNHVKKMNHESINKIFANRKCEIKNNKISTPHYDRNCLEHAKDSILRRETVEIANSTHCAHSMLENIKANKIFKKVKIKIGDNEIETYRPLILGFPTKNLCYNYYKGKENIRSLDNLLGFDLRVKGGDSVKLKSVLISEIFVDNPNNFLYKLNSKVEQSEEEVSLFNKTINEIYKSLNRNLDEEEKKSIASKFQINGLPPTYGNNIRVVGGNIVLEQSIYPVECDISKKLLEIFESMWLGEYLVNRTLELRKDAHVKFPTTNWKLEIEHDDGEDMKLVYYDKNGLENLIENLRKELNIELVNEINIGESDYKEALEEMIGKNNNDKDDE